MVKDKKDKKNKSAQKKARVAQKTEKKAQQKDKKASSRPKKTNGEDGDSDSDGDLDAILASYAAQQEQYNKILETTLSAPPPPRSSATILSNPSDSREVFIFGGETMRGGNAVFFNDLLVLRQSTSTVTDQSDDERDHAAVQANGSSQLDSWRCVTSPNSPLPRSGHAMCKGANTNLLYVFGGEFSSPKQGTFHHYNDFWSLEPSTRQWTRLESSSNGRGINSPSARSGHRMVSWKRFIILFGGFQDTSQNTKYLDDLWIYDTLNYNWFEPKISGGIGGGKPDARSSFSILPHENGAVIVGGYSRVKTTSGKSAANANGKKGKTAGSSGGSGGKVVVKPVVHQDCWFLKIIEADKESGEKVLPTIKWERRKKPVNFPSPARAGATMAYHKGRGIMFGGVHDVEESEEGIESQFFNQLWAYNIERNRFFPLALRRPRMNVGKKPNTQDRNRRAGRTKADEEDLLRNLAMIEDRNTSTNEKSEAETITPSHDIPLDDQAQSTRIERPVIYEMPHARFNAQLTVQDDTLFIYGGTFEKGDREFTFDEMWTIDLGKMDGAKEVFRREIEDWAGEDSDSSSSSDEDDSEYETDKESDNEVEEHDRPHGESDKQQPHDLVIETVDEAIDDEMPVLPSAKDDGLPYPLPFESLRDFYSRTTAQWQEIAVTAARTGTSMFAVEKSAKEFKKDAFDSAEQRWWDVREEIQVLEAEREEGGVGDVVSLADRDREKGVGNRRR